MRTSIAAIVLSMTISSCFFTKEYPVESDYNYLGRFEDYKSFSFFEVNNDTSAFHRLVRNNIVNQMQIRGYDYDKESPELLVQYRFYEDSLIFKGYEQPTFSFWMNLKRANKSRKIEDYKKKMIDMKHGTLLIQFYDQSSSQSIWQGYTTTKYGDQSLNDPRNLRLAVNSIMAEYRQFTTEREEQIRKNKLKL